MHFRSLVLPLGHSELPLPLFCHPHIVEELVLSFREMDYTVREDEGPLEVVLMASRSASFKYSVTVTPTATSNAGSATGELSHRVVTVVSHKPCVCIMYLNVLLCTAGEDFVPEPLTAMFAPGQREASVFLDIVDNAEVEPDESLLLQMEVSADLTSVGVSVAGDGQSMVSIQDNDGECTCII